MAVEARPELVGKRFLCVSGDEPPEIGDIGRWPWRSGVIRAVNHRDNDTTDLTVRKTLTLSSSFGLCYMQSKWETVWLVASQRANVVNLPGGNYYVAFLVITGVGPVHSPLVCIIVSLKYLSL